MLLLFTHVSVSVCHASDDAVCTLVTDLSEVTEGEQFIIVSQRASVGMSREGNENGNRITTVDVSFSEDYKLAYASDDVARFTLVRINSTKYYLRTDDGRYLNFKSASSPDVNYSSQQSETAKLSVSLGKDGNALIYFDKNSYKRYLYYVQSKCFGGTESVLTSDAYVHIYRASTKIPTNVQFDVSTSSPVEVVYGETATLSPKATVCEVESGDVVADAVVSYKSSNERVATVGSDGTVTINDNKVYGETTITATFAGDETHYGSSGKYMIAVRKDALKETSTSFGSSVDGNTFFVREGEEDAFANKAAVLTPEEIGGRIKYKSDNKYVATVDEAGNIQLWGLGDAVITAYFEGDDQYAPSSASYNIRYSTDWTVYSKDDESFGNLKAGGYATGNYTLVDTDGNKAVYYVENGYKTRQNQGVFQLKSSAISPVIDAPNGYAVIVDYYQSYSASASSKVLTIRVDKSVGSLPSVFKSYGELSETEGTGYRVTSEAYGSSSFTIKPGNVAKISCIQIMRNPNYNMGIAEDTDNGNTLDKYDGKMVNIRLNRVLVANKWNTFCVPFDIELEGGRLAGVKANVREYDKMEGDVVRFKQSDKIIAGRAYLVMPEDENIENPLFDNVIIKNVEPERCGDDNFYMKGTYSPKTFDADICHESLFLNSEAVFLHPNPGTTMNGMRAYFYSSSSEQTNNLKVSFADEETGVSDISITTVKDGGYYRLDGAAVGNDRSALPNGVYVLGGKKLVIK